MPTDSQDDCIKAFRARFGSKSQLTRSEIERELQRVQNEIKEDQIRSPLPVEFDRLRHAADLYDHECQRAYDGQAYFAALLWRLQALSAEC